MIDALIALLPYLEDVVGVFPLNEEELFFLSHLNRLVFDLSVVEFVEPFAEERNSLFFDLLIVAQKN